jgi:hypothetical protein
MATTERDVLQGKVLPELQAIASSMGVQGYLRLRKADLIGAIIAKAQGEEFTPSTTPTRSRRAGSSTAAAATGEPADAPADAAPAAVASERFNDLGLLSNFKSVRIDTLLEHSALHMKRRYLMYQRFVVGDIRSARLVCRPRVESPAARARRARSSSCVAASSARISRGRRP